MGERVGMARGPASAGFVAIKKEGVGETRVHPRAFEKTWSKRGWELVEPEAPADPGDETTETDEGGDGGDTDAPSPTPETTQNRRKPGRAADTTSEES